MGPCVRRHDSLRRHAYENSICDGPCPSGGRVSTRSSYLNAEKRLSKEFGGRIGCEPATWPSFGAGAAAAGVRVSEGDGFSGGRAATTCFVSDATGVDALGAGVSGRGGGFRLASMSFGFAGTGCAVAVVSAPPRPTLRARLLKKPSDCAFGTADATRVAEVGAWAGAIEAARGSSGEVTGPRGGLTCEGMGPGARESATSDRPCPSPPSDNPVLPSGSLEANTLFMPPSMPVLTRATGVPLAISWAVSA